MSTVVGVGPVRKEVAHVGGTLSGLAMGDPVHGSVAGVSAAVVVVELRVTERERGREMGQSA